MATVQTDQVTRPVESPDANPSARRVSSSCSQQTSVEVGWKDGAKVMFSASNIPCEGSILPDTSGNYPRPTPKPKKKTQCSQTSKGKLSGEKLRQHSLPLATAAVPSKEECFSDLRLFQLVRDGTYDEVLKELEAAPPDDVEAKWNKIKLLRLVQKQRQMTYGSIRNPVTSKRKDLIPSINASTAKNLDAQLPYIEPPSAEVVASRMLQTLAVLHDVQKKPPSDHKLRATHDRMYVPQELYVEKEISRRSISSPLDARASSPLVCGLPLLDSLSREFSSTSFSSLSTKLDERSRSSLGEISRSSTQGTRDSRQSGRLSAPLTVNEDDWNPRSTVAANDASRRDRRMNSPVSEKSGEWSRISYSSLPAPESHGVWGPPWKHPLDVQWLNAIKAGVDTQGIRTINSNEFFEVSALLDTMTDTVPLAPFSPTNFVERKKWPGESLKTSSVRQVLEFAHKEAEDFVMKQHTLRRKQLNESLERISSTESSAMDTVDKMMNLTIEKAHDMWKAAINCLPAVDEVEKSRLDEALQLTLLMEKQENQNYKRKAPLQDIWKSDVVAKALEREEMTTKSIYKTILSILQHAAKLSAVYHEHALKKVAAAEQVVLNTKNGNRTHMEKLSVEENASRVSAEQLAKFQAEKDQTMNAVKEKETEINEHLDVLATLKHQIKKFVAKAFESSKEGKPDTVKEWKDKADAASARSKALLVDIEKLQQEVDLLNDSLKGIDKELAEWENINHKDQVRLEECQKLCAVEQARLQDLINRLDKEKTEEEALKNLVLQRRAAAEDARQNAENPHEDVSPVCVLSRLRASSLILVAKQMIASDNMNLKTEEQEPIYLGERIDGKRHGFGILQYAAGAEYVGLFENDLPSGIGTERFSDGTSFEGGFKDGMRHGMGVYRMPGKIAYLGLFDRGKRAGPGVVCVTDSSDSVPFWPTVVCMCRADMAGVVSAETFRTKCKQHALLVIDVLKVHKAAKEMTKRARAKTMTAFFSKQEHAQIESREFMGLTPLGKYPSIASFERTNTFAESQPAIAMKLKDIEAVAQLAATPGGRKAAKRAKDRARLPFERGEGRRHDIVIQTYSQAMQGTPMQKYAQSCLPAPAALAAPAPESHEQSIACERKHGTTPKTCITPYGTRVRRGHTDVL